MGKLDGKIALITGGTTGIGLATTQLFQKEGAQVIITGRNKNTIAAAQQTLGPKVQVVQSDTSKLADINKLAEDVRRTSGRVDILFANAGIAKPVPFEQVDEQVFDEQFNINVKGLYFTIQKLLPLIPKGGSVLLNASIAGSKGFPTWSVYSATKAAARSLGRSLAAELAAKEIRVNTISPGPIVTPIFGKTGLTQEAISDFEKNFSQLVALKRFGQPAEVANTALFLASQDSSYVTGAEIFVDGGFAGL